MQNTYDILHKAIAQYESGEFEQAIQTASEAAADKEYAFTYNELTAHCYYSLAQYSNAIWFYEKALKLEPARHELASRLAAAYDLSGQPKKAALLHRKNLRAHPDDPHFNYQLGYHLLGKGRHREALQHLHKAYSAQPGINPEIHFFIGVCYHNLRQWEDALTFLEAQAEVKDGIADCYHLIGNCYRNLYNDEKAINAYSQAIWYNQDHADAYWQRFLTKKDKGDYEGAEADIRRALAINPNRITLTSKEGNPLHIVAINVNRSNGNVDFVVK